MIPKPKYLENILEITKHKDNWIYCDVICECGSKQFVGYKNVLIKTPEQLEHEKHAEAFYRKYSSFTSVTENGVRYICGMKGLFKNKIGEKLEITDFDYTQIVKVKCTSCGKEHILFDSRFHGYDGVMPERQSTYDNEEYEFISIKWKNDEEGIATFSIRIENDESYEDFVENAFDTDLETYSNAFGWILIESNNIKTGVKKTILNEETS
jgi:hypothetical protein